MALLIVISILSKRGKSFFFFFLGQTREKYIEVDIVKTTWQLMKTEVTAIAKNRKLTVANVDF